MKRLLIVEDSEKKYRDVVTAVSVRWPGELDIHRADTVQKAESQISNAPWTALILDVSMNIANSSKPGQGGHATTGGLTVARKMYLTGKLVPTVIATAFGSFQGRQVERGRVVMIGLEEVQDRAMETLGDNFLGCVRYNQLGWEKELIAALEGVLG